MTNGVLAGDYNIKMDIVDMSTGNSVSSGNGFTSVDGLVSLEPQQAANTSWINPYNGWEDGKTYNLSFYAELADGTPSGNTHYYHITFEDDIDVAILSGPTDANRLKTVREDLQNNLLNPVK